MLPCQRALFDIPDDIAYLNAAYMGPLPKAAVAAGAVGVSVKARPWQISPADFFEPMDDLRALFARLIGAPDGDGVALIPSASYGLSLAAANLPVAPGQRILVLAEQFPSNVYPWRRLAAEAGAVLETLPRRADGDWTRALLDALEETPTRAPVAVVACPQVHWSDGGLIDLERVGAACRRVGAALVVDGTQSVGALPFDVATVAPDFLVVAGYKWLLGPYSLGYLYAAPHRRAGRPLEDGWITREGSRNFAALTEYTDALDSSARRYDVGERSNFALVPVARVGLSLLADWTPAAVAAYAGRLSARLVTETASLGCTALPEAVRAPHLLGLGLPEGVDGAALTKRLAEAQVSVSLRGPRLRLAPHIYNTDADVDRLLSVLAEVLSPCA